MKTILITGAESGIGRDSAVALAKKGHVVIATAHTLVGVELLREYSKAQNINLQIEKLDITDRNDREKIKGFNLDVLINNAGIGESGPLSEIPEDRLRKVFETNLFGTIALSQLALGQMVSKKKGTVLIVSSIAGRIPSQFLAPYGMTKFALSAGAAAMRREIHRIAPNVHVSLIEPGAYATGFNQEMLDKKYEWIKEGSQFFNLIPALKVDDKRFIQMEKKSTESIVAQIVKASESEAPKLRYVAPFSMRILVRIARIFN